MLDFGIARAMDSTTLTQTASVVGTAAYMSPEQATGRPADERSDIYSLGCVLYALLAGHPPFTGDGAAAILNQHANSPPRAPRMKNGQVSLELDALVMQMLAKSPDDRPQSAAQVRDQLASPSPAGRSAPSATTAATARLDPTTATRVLPTAPRPGRRRLILAGALAAVMLAIAVVVLASGGSSPHTSTTTGHGTTRAKTSTPTTGIHVTRPTTTAVESTERAAITPTTTASQTAQPSTVSGAADALTALASQDVEAGTIDQHAAKQITNGLSDILNSYEMGHTMDIQPKLADVSQHIAMLEQHGDITSAAVPALNQAVANLTAVFANAPTTTTGTPGGHPPQSPRHPDRPPVKAKHPHAHDH